MLAALEADGRAVRNGEETVSDMNYLHGFAGIRRSESLYFEKRMLDNWFKTRFVDSRAGGG